MLSWVLLAGAIVFEVMAVSAMKLTDGFRKIWPWAVIVALCFGLSLYMLSLTLNTLPVGVVYAIWTGAGIVLTTIVGQILFKQKMDRPALIGMALILAGVIVLQVFSTAIPR